MRRFDGRRAMSVRKKSPNFTASNLGENCVTSCPFVRLTAPNRATDFRVGACSSMGSVSSGGTHIRQRVPCC